MYHVMSSGAQRDDIFLTDVDRSLLPLLPSVVTVFRGQQVLRSGLRSLLSLCPSVAICRFA